MAVGYNKGILRPSEGKFGKYKIVDRDADMSNFGYSQLLCDDKVISTNHPGDATAKGVLSKAEGRVIVIGLGIDNILYELWKSEKVIGIKAVEKDQQLISIVKRLYTSKMENFDIIKCDCSYVFPKCTCVAWDRFSVIYDLMRSSIRRLDEQTY